MGDAGTKWTPGPWTFQHDADGDFAIFGGVKLVCVTEEDCEADEANAQLICAAQELYKALEAALRCLRGVAESAEEAAHVEDWAEAALRQARGEKQL